MSANFPFLGYVYQDGFHDVPARLNSVAEILAFLKEHLCDDQVILTDRSDELWFQSMGGVDHFSRLDELGIDLPELFRMQRQEIVAELSQPEGSPQPWEEVYDQVGLDPGEIRMRQRVKKLAREAQTVEDVARLVEGTYFDVFFSRAGGEPSLGYFDPQDYSAEFIGEGAPSRQESRIVLDPRARVRHVASGEDIHLFHLIDFPG